jgi:Na+-transporting NADH:ubiquinone oxidoreductase subunit NqrD
MPKGPGRSLIVATLLVLLVLGLVVSRFFVSETADYLDNHIGTLATDVVIALFVCVIAGAAYVYSRQRPPD